MHCSRNASHLPKTSPGPLARYCKQRYTICTVRPTQFPGAPNNTATEAHTPIVFNGTQIPIYRAVRITHTLPLMRHPERSDEGMKSIKGACCSTPLWIWIISCFSFLPGWWRRALPAFRRCPARTWSHRTRKSCAHSPQYGGSSPDSPRSR